MKQLSIYCSHDLEARVVAALDHAGVDGFFRTASGTGCRFLERGRLPRTTEWEAASFVVPALADEQVERVVAELEDWAGQCDFEPCLRIVVSAVERVV